MTFCCVPIVPGGCNIVYDLWSLLFFLISLSARQYNGTFLASRGYVAPSPSHVQIMFQIRMSLNVTARQKVQAHKKTTNTQPLKVLFMLFWRCVTCTHLALFLHQWLKCWRIQMLLYIGDMYSLLCFHYFIVSCFRPRSVFPITVSQKQICTRSSL